MQEEVIITLDKFKPRPYQLPIFKALEEDGFKKILVIWPRRAGKDMVSFQLLIRAAFRRVGSYYYVFPTFSSGRRILWDAICSDGTAVLDFIPKEVIESKNEQMMRIKLINGSLIQIIGSQDFNKTLIGTNPVGFIFSEYALQDENAYKFSKMIIQANDGFACILSTPRGRNHLYDLYQIAKVNPKHWFTSFLTIKDTKHVSEEEIQAEVDRGELSWEMAQQEWYCDFNLGIEGSVYGTVLDRMRLNGQIGNVPWQPQYKVETAWDIGNEGTSIIFFQSIGQVFHIIDHYEKSREQLEFYVNILNSKPYTYGRHYFPFDMKITEWGGKKFTRVEKARQLGIKADIVDSVGLEDGIEYVKSSMSKIWIDEKKCEHLIAALENYRYEYDTIRSMYKNKPVHDKWSHACDALRYACLSFPKSRIGLTQEDIDRQKAEALYGNKSNLPEFFRDDQPWHKNPVPF